MFSCFRDKFDSLVKSQYFGLPRFSKTPLAERGLFGLGLGNLIKKQKQLFFFIIFLFAFSKCAYAEDFQILQRGSISVFFEAPLESAAKQVSDLYPGVKENLGSIFGWKLYLSPSIILIKDRNNFLRMAGDPLVVAFAVPQRNLIVIDYSKMITHPFSLETTLKHELCHILLHEHIKTEILPRWLDEGLCQWASGGIGEIIMDQKRSRLNRAAFSREFIRLQDLQQIFPPDENSRLLAYEQSKSFVSYLVRQFGKGEILNVLKKMKQGETTEVAFSKVLSIPLEKLESEWQDSLGNKMTWFTYLSYYLYEILFALMALITVCAFVRLSIKKKGYVDDEVCPNTDNVV